jgi:hypothetical protein
MRLSLLGTSSVSLVFFIGLFAIRRRSIDLKWKESFLLSGRLLGVAVLLSMLGLLIYTVLLSSPAQASPKDVIVVTKTRGREELKAAIVDGQLQIKLKNNHAETITAYAISFGDLTIKEDFAYSEVNFGIEPGDTLEKSYSVSPSGIEVEPPTIYLLAVLLKDGTKDGDSKVAHQIKDERLGEKIQIFRTLKILEKEVQPRRDLKAIKSDIVAALNTGEVETRVSLNDLQPTAQVNSKVSDDLRSGLQVGREKMLRRFEVLEQLPIEDRDRGFAELKERANKLFAKL